MNQHSSSLKKISSIFFCIFLLHSPCAYALEGQININKADAKELTELPFINKTRAKAIINCRKDANKFQNLKELERCPDIENTVFNAIKPYLSLKGSGRDVSSPPSYRSTKSKSHQSIPRIIGTTNGIIVLPNKAYYKVLMNFIRFAEKRIDISMFLFKATKSPKNKPALLTRALIAAHKRGVKVTVTLENSGYDAKLNEENRRVANHLTKNGIQVHFDIKKITTHTKIAVIDKRFCFVGSHNFTHTALTYSNELSLLVDSKKMASELLGYIEEIVN